jgi:hypothetical protein
MGTRRLSQAVGMKHPSVTIIGMGPRGRSILERIAAYARGTACRLQVNLVEPNECGPGVHSPRQPQHLLINTVASQVTIFPSRDSVAIAPVCATPSLTEWARAQGYRRFGEQFHQVEPDSGGAEVTDTGYLPRQLLATPCRARSSIRARCWTPTVAWENYSRF